MTLQFKESLWNYLKIQFKEKHLNQPFGIIISEFHQNFPFVLLYRRMAKSLSSSRWAEISKFKMLTSLKSVGIQKKNTFTLQQLYVYTLHMLCLRSLSAFRLRVINIVEAVMFIYNISFTLPYRSLINEYGDIKTFAVSLHLLMLTIFPRCFGIENYLYLGCRKFACKCTHIC